MLLLLVSMTGHAKLQQSVRGCQCRMVNGIMRIVMGLLQALVEQVQWYMAPVPRFEEDVHHENKHKSGGRELSGNKNWPFVSLTPWSLLFCSFCSLAMAAGHCSVNEKFEQPSWMADAVAVAVAAVVCKT